MKTSTSWKKGESGNYAGRPLKPLTEALRKAANKKIKTEDGKFITNKDAMAEAMVKEAKRGNPQAFGIVADRLEGKVRESHDVEGNMTIRIIRETKNE